MLPLEYLKEKNKLIRKVTGKILIPKKQLVNVAYSEDFEAETELLIVNCPYCNIYYNSEFKCNGCPMYEAGNVCNNKASTYYKANTLWMNTATRDDRNELYQLGLKYKRSKDD